MAPGKWASMGGEICKTCDCRQDEWSLSNCLGRIKTNAAFQSHWDSWFTQSDVDQIVADGLNTVRIPIGFWILEDIVDTKTEPYAQGGLDQLVNSLWPFRLRPSVCLMAIRSRVLIDPRANDAQKGGYTRFVGPACATWSQFK